MPYHRLVNFISVITLIRYCFAVDRGATCFTPNNERALCLSVKSCKVITDAIVTGNNKAINFAKQSQCGYDYEPLVCCGSTGYPISTFTFGFANRETQVTTNKVVPFEHHLLPNKTICGIQRSDHRIFGGQKTDLDEFPWAALLRYEDGFGEDAGFKCGGTLINQRYVLTAAHCVVLISSSGLIVTSVRLGEWRISTEKDCLGEKRFEECADPVVDVDVEETVAHSHYSRRNHINDIALIRLKQNIAYTDFVRPICLTSPLSRFVSVGTKMVVVGWGATERNPSSDLKLKVQVPVISNSECAQKIRVHGRISENHICAGGIQGKDSCQGDSGGPLMRMVDDQSAPQWFQEGIISWGVGCGVAQFPGVYTRVTKYVNWVVDHMKL